MLASTPPRISIEQLLVSAVALVAATAISRDATAVVTIETVTIGDLGNATDSGGFGRVAYEYNLAKYDVTIHQYTKFLNAVAKSDPYNLYNDRMATDLNVAGISRSGAPGSYTYDEGPVANNRPITYVSWFDAARFTNWMVNGQGTAASTESGAYTLLRGAISGTTPAKNSGATFYLPSENEWYKAAYYSPTLNSGAGGYWGYATQSNSPPGNVVGGTPNQANYFTNGRYSATQSSWYVESQNYLTEVGAFPSSRSYYGTFDQSGNVYQWTDATGTELVAIRGGSWQDEDVSAATRLVTSPDDENPICGFRIAALVATPPPPPPPPPPRVLIDVGDGKLTVSLSTLTTGVVEAIVAGRGDGSWNGSSGVTSSQAAKDLAQGVSRTVGWLDNGDSSVTLAYAAAGDANCDWWVDVVDVSNILTSAKFDTGLLTTWLEGDFNHDGILDALDLADVLNTGLYDAGMYNPRSGVSGNLATAVPEPSLSPLIATMALAVSILTIHGRRMRVR
jgi:sulfatase modifying factor 1